MILLKYIMTLTSDILHYYSHIKYKHYWIGNRSSLLEKFSHIHGLETVVCYLRISHTYTD